MTRLMILFAVAMALAGPAAAQTEPPQKGPEAPVCNNDPPAQFQYSVSRVPQALEAEWGRPLRVYCDDCSVFVALPFAVNLFGYDYASAYVTPNGFINLASYDGQYWNNAGDLYNKVAIAPEWDDWDTRCGGDVYVNDALADRVVFTWQVRHYPACWYGGPMVTFQAVLFRDGRIQFNYGENQNGNTSATTGISTADPTIDPSQIPLDQAGWDTYHNAPGFLFAASPSTQISIAGTAGNAPWYRTQPVVTFVVTENGVPVARTEYSFDGGATWTTYAGPLTVADGITTITYRSIGTNGFAEVAKSQTLFVDSTPPVIDSLLPAPGQEFVLNQPPIMLDFTIADSNGSGLAGSSSVPEAGVEIPLDVVGGHTVEITAQDVAGNTARLTVPYYVRYAFSGFLPPLTNGKSFKNGQTVPFKFQLADFNGAVVSTAQAALYVAETPATSTSRAVTGNQFRFDPVAQQYVFNLNSKASLGAPGTFEGRALLDDGSVRSVTFSTVP